MTTMQRHARKQSQVFGGMKYASRPTASAAYIFNGMTLTPDRFAASKRIPHNIYHCYCEPLPGVWQSQRKQSHVSGGMKYASRPTNCAPNT